MKRLQRIAEFQAIVSVSIGVIVAQQAAQFAANLNISFWLPPVVALIAIATTIQTVKYILEMRFEHSTRLRRAFLGNQFVEGTWFDVMRRDDGQVAFGISQISCSGTALHLAGEDYDVGETVYGHYRADLLTVDWPVIRYKYTYHKSNDPSFSKQGYGELQFVHRDGIPKRYTGFFFDLLEGKRTSFEGWKIEDKEILARLEMPNTRKSTLRMLTNQFFLKD